MAIRTSSSHLVIRNKSYHPDSNASELKNPFHYGHVFFSLLPGWFRNLVCKRVKPLHMGKFPKFISVVRTLQEAQAVLEDSVKHITSVCGKNQFQQISCKAAAWFYQGPKLESESRRLGPA
ncbi:MAG: hypothetical protein Ct9H300mP28_15850 [Pseudomonadota bacterium]|nr:MAG: hypothetical protein Ct9H300mP28_15850 [Pseudomonadota bacterium]